MTLEEYNAALKALGASGPAGEIRLPSGAFVLVYYMPDRSAKHLPPGSSMSCEQRRDVIQSLQKHLGIMAAGTRGSLPDC